MVEYAFAEELERTCKSCATIARAKLKEWWTRGLIPKPEDLTATVTFIRIEGRSYAVTAWHVIEYFEQAAIADGAYPEGYFLPVKPGVGIGPPFVHAPQPWTAPRPDIALRPIDVELPARIGKEFFEVRLEAAPNLPVPYAMAVGFPTLSKSIQREE